MSLTVKPEPARDKEWRRLVAVDGDIEVGTAIIDRQHWLTIVTDDTDAEATLLHAACGLVADRGVQRLRIRLEADSDRQRLMAAYKAVAHPDHVYVEVAAILADDTERWISLADAAKALASVVKTRVLRTGRVSEYEYEVRLSICAKCEVATLSDTGHPKWCGKPGKKTCKSCGCYLPEKAIDAAQRCPRNKWPEQLEAPCNAEDDNEDDRESDRASGSG